ncbi:MAG: alpha/beta fold hydrolase [Rhodospirillaceae bacterium]|nr:alpha/beta fold hydrolase [Rhodospirillaceae bacterium]MCY4311543.1 alpha/beta fold hydrolase [Rhodospirillaceae bacterium]
MKRRDALKIGAVGLGSYALASSGAHGASHRKPSFVLVHGAWHGAWAWSEMTVRLAKAGHAAFAVDLPGAGTRARFPASFLKRPLDKKAFATEVSPTRSLTQDERNAYVADVVKSAATIGNGKVVLVGHSWGGNTISHVTEAVPELVYAVVYLVAFMLPPGISPSGMLQDKSYASGQVNPLLMADPGKVGALRLDPRSLDPAYVTATKRAFYADLSDAQFVAVANLLHCDEPAQTAGVKSPITAARFGKVSRHFIRCEDDRAMPAAAQDRMVELVDGAGVGGKTVVHKMSGSHSPFFAQPDALLEVFRKIAT